MVAVLEYNGPGAQTRWLQVGCEKQCREIALESLWKPRLNHRTVYRWSPLVFCFARGFRLWHSLVWPRLWYGRVKPNKRGGIVYSLSTKARIQMGNGTKCMKRLTWYDTCHCL